MNQINPQNTSLIPYEEMLKAGVHFGRKKTVFHPGMKKYVFAVRDGISIIDLLKTDERLAEAIRFMRKTLEEGKTILFVAPTKQSREAVLQTAQALNMPYVLDRWLGGTLTNFKVINGRVKKLEEMEAAKASGGLDKYTKKERLLFDRELAKMSRSFEGLKKLNRMPDVVFVASMKEGQLPIQEALSMKVKVVTLANTDADPKKISYVIPANDRSKKSVSLVVDAIRDQLVATLSHETK